jgi:transposase InsO family protein
VRVAAQLSPAIGTFLPPTLLQRPVESGQYTSLAFGQAARDAGIARSMGSKGSCFDNAVLESLHATIEKDLIHRRS